MFSNLQQPMIQNPFELKLKTKLQSTRFGLCRKTINFNCAEKNNQGTQLQLSRKNICWSRSVFISVLMNPLLIQFGESSGITYVGGIDEVDDGDCDFDDCDDGDDDDGE